MLMIRWLVWLLHLDDHDLILALFRRTEYAIFTFSQNPTTPFARHFHTGMLCDSVFDVF